MNNRLLSFTLLVVIMIIFPIYSGSVFPADSLEVKPIHPEAKATTIYEVKFTISDTLPADGQIIVAFPRDFDLSGVIMAGSSTINGGFKVEVKDSTVILRRSGLGRAILPNEKVEVKFANVKNPSTPEQDYNIQVEIQRNSGAKIVEQIKRVKIIPKTELLR